jgi:hypothetical protein
VGIIKIFNIFPSIIDNIFNFPTYGRPLIRMGVKGKLSDMVGDLFLCPM